MTPNMNSNSKAVWQLYMPCRKCAKQFQQKLFFHLLSLCILCTSFQAPTLGNVSVEVMQAWRAWYFLSCDHGVIKIGPEFLEQKSNILHVVQPTMHSTLGVHDICPLIRVVSCRLPLLFFLYESFGTPTHN